MQITEQDLFIYVFYPQELESDKFEYISKNNDLFNSEIQFLNDIMRNKSMEIEPGLFDRLINKINSINKSTIIHLSKTKNLEDIHQEQIVLAAASQKLKKTFQSDTFVDDGSKFMVKMLSNEKFNKIFVLERNNNELRNVKLTVFPSGESYSLKTNREPLIIEPRQSIDDISLVSYEEFQ